MLCVVDSVVSGPLSLPHLLPLLRLMEGEDAVETTDRGCLLLYNLLQSARNATLHARDCTLHAHSLLSGNTHTHTTCSQPALQCCTCTHT